MIRLFLLALLPGCDISDDACALADANSICPACDSGEATCTYGEYSVTLGSCGDCQARATLYLDLCDAGITDDEQTIEDGTECVSGE